MRAHTVSTPPRSRSPASTRSTVPCATGCSVGGNASTAERRGGTSSRRPSRTTPTRHRRCSSAPRPRSPPTCSPEALSSAASTQFAQQNSAATAALIAALADLVTTPRPFLRWDPGARTIGGAPSPLHRGRVPADARGAQRCHRPDHRRRTRSHHRSPERVRARRSRDAPRARTASGARIRNGTSHRRRRASSTPSCTACSMHAFGSGDADAIRDALAVALRESGSFLDPTIADITNAGARIAQPGVEFHASPTAEVPTATTPEDLQRGDPLTPGQYVIHDVDDLVVPYLPDPLAHRLVDGLPRCRTRPSIGWIVRDRGRHSPVFGRLARAPPGRGWCSSPATELAAAIVDDVITMQVPAGEQLRFRLSTSMERAALHLLGLWRSLPAALQNLDFLAEAAADGWLWWLTPCGRDPPHPCRAEAHRSTPADGADSGARRG